MADNIRRPARARMWKRIAIALASVSTAALVVFVILSFLPQGNAAFTIRIDDPYKKDESESHFVMKTYENGELKPTGDIIKDSSLDHMVPTTAALVEEHLAELNDTAKGNKLNKSQNWCTYKDASQTEIDRGLAQIYTVYLVNESKTDDQHLKYTVQADSYARTDTNDVLNYFRVLVQKEVVGDESSLENTYHGYRHSDDKTKDYKNELGDNREPISTYERAWQAETIKALYHTNSGAKPEDGYCTNFQELNETNKALVNAIDFTIPAGKTLRFTYVAYFEGEDMDCHGSIPAGSYLLLSLHFGV